MPPVLRATQHAGRTFGSQLSSAVAGGGLEKLSEQVGLVAGDSYTRAAPQHLPDEPNLFLSPHTPFSIQPIHNLHVQPYHLMEENKVVCRHVQTHHLASHCHVPLSGIESWNEEQFAVYGKQLGDDWQNADTSCARLAHTTEPYAHVHHLCVDGLARAGRVCCQHHQQPGCQHARSHGGCLDTRCTWCAGVGCGLWPAPLV